MDTLFKMYTKRFKNKPEKYIRFNFLGKNAIDQIYIFHYLLHEVILAHSSRSLTIEMSSNVYSNGAYAFGNLLVWQDGTLPPEAVPGAYRWSDANTWLLNYHGAPDKMDDVVIPKEYTVYLDVSTPVRFSFFSQVYSL